MPGLSVNQWTVLVCLGVLVFIGLALATGLMVGRAFRRPLAAVTLATGPAVDSRGEPLSTQSEARVDQQAGAGRRQGGTRPLFKNLLAASEEAPRFQLEALDGGTMSLEELEGHTVLLNFWATWCTWCRYELPALQAVYQKYRDEGLVVVGVNVEEPRPLVEAYVQRYGVSFPVVLDIDGSTADAYQVRGLPMTYFVGPTGAIVHVQRGAMREDELELYVRNVLTAGD